MHSPRASLLTLLLTPLLLPLLGGCTAGRASFVILNAQREYQEALSQGADAKAVYECTLAYEYLQKAREEAGYSQYRAVENLCNTSISWSQAAYTVASGEGIPDPDQSVVPEERVEKPPETTTPTNELDLDLDE